MRPIKIILTQSEKGGCGKTTIHEAIIAGLMAGGMRVLVVDADDGNSGYVRRAGEKSAVALSWATGAEALPAWLAANLADNDVLAVDCGANILASGAPINEFLGNLLFQIKSAGGDAVALAIASTNAPGADRIVRNMRDAYGDYASVRLVRNNQDGSSAFPPSLATLGMPSAIFAHVSAGIQAARLLTRAPLLDVLRTPPAGYDVAMASYADVVARFMAESGVSDLFGDGAVDIVRALAAKAPGELRMVVNRLEYATDTALAANHALYRNHRAFRQAVNDNRADHVAISIAALAMHDAEKAYAAAVN